jgi:murein DD-endopeptidase MepM/ murein hydrolase activator NlpD
MRPHLILILFSICFVFTGCLQYKTNPGEGTAMRIAQSPSPILTQNFLESPTPVVAEESVQLIETVSPIQNYPSSTIDPLQFTFPTVFSEPNSIWRPPLYSVPWEPTPYDHFYFSRPIGANEINWPLANYRYGGVFFEDTVHTGIDIPAPKGTPVLAAGSGEVIWAGWGLYFMREEFRDPYGMAVAIKHDFGYEGQSLYTIYGHMDEILTWRGKRVVAGETIGRVGETGKVTGPHLHFEVRIGDNTYSKSRNPELWIAPPQGWGVLVARVMATNGNLLVKHRVNIRNVETNHYWYVITYGGEGSTNSDYYYRENMVIGDLPSGSYVIWIEYESRIYDKKIVIQPGIVSYFSFQGNKGYNIELPSTPGLIFATPQLILTPNP